MNMDGNGFPGFFEIEIRLKLHPEAFRIAKAPGQPDRGVRAYAALAKDDFVDAPGRHTELARERVLADALRLEKILPQHLAGMNAPRSRHMTEPVI